MDVIPPSLTGLPDLFHGSTSLGKPRIFHNRAIWVASITTEIVRQHNDS